MRIVCKAAAGLVVALLLTTGSVAEADAPNATTDCKNYSYPTGYDLACKKSGGGYTPQWVDVAGEGGTKQFGLYTVYTWSRTTTNFRGTFDGDWALCSINWGWNLNCTYE